MYRLISTFVIAGLAAMLDRECYSRYVCVRRYNRKSISLPSIVTASYPLPCSVGGLSVRVGKVMRLIR